MARPRMPLPSAGAVRALVDGDGLLSVRVTPGAKTQMLEVDGARLLAKVRAKPEDGKANEAVRDIIAAALDIAPSRVELLRGATSREKQFRIG